MAAGIASITLCQSYDCIYRLPVQISPIDQASGGTHQLTHRFPDDVLERVDTLLIGAGQSGLSMSYHLRQQGREHILLERGRVGERWRSERWDSLRFQFPASFVRLPDFPYAGEQPDGFIHRDEVIDVLQCYAHHIAAPVRCGVTARRIRQGSDGDILVDLDSHTIAARNVVCAIGPYQAPTVPTVATNLPHDVAQLTANRYVNAGQIEPGAVLVVGSGSSGYQIAEDLNDAGRDVVLAVGSHRGFPRNYRGRDTMDWLDEIGVTRRPSQVTSEGGLPVLLSGHNGGERVDIRWLFQQGVRMVGRLERAEGSLLHFSQDVNTVLAAADQGREAWKQLIDEYLETNGKSAPPPKVEETPPPLPPTPPRLDLTVEGIRTVIWATGYRFDLGWIDLPVITPNGEPIHDCGVTTVPGFYFMGLPYMRSLSSALFWGAGADAEFLAKHIAERR